MKIKFSQKDREALAKSINSFENEKLVDVLNVVGAVGNVGWSRSTWERSTDEVFV